MFFASKRISELETELERLANRVELLAQQWEQAKISLTDLQETAGHMLARLAQRHRRELKRCTEEVEDQNVATGAPPGVDEVTARILARRSRHVSTA